MADLSNNSADPQIESVDGIVLKAQSLYYENKNIFFGIVIAILAVFASGFAYSYYAGVQEHKAQVLLSQAEALFKTADYQKALKGDDINLTPGLENIIANFGRTDAGNLAYYYASVSEFNLGHFDIALGYIDKFDQPTGILGVGPIAFKASVLAELGENAKAAYQFEKAANWVKTETTTPMYLLEAAKFYLLANDKTKATKLVNALLEDYPTGVYSSEAQRLKGKLS